MYGIIYYIICVPDNMVGQVVCVTSPRTEQNSVCCDSSRRRSPSTSPPRSHFPLLLHACSFALTYAP